VTPLESAAPAHRAASAVVHAAAGSPPFVDARPLPAGARCWLCASSATRGVERVPWEGSNYQDQNTCRDQGSPYVCEACAYACSWVAPPGVEIAAGKQRGPCLRQYTHLYDGDGYAYGNKAQKPLILAWLRKPKHPPWFAAIADSGQKHLLPWTPVNLGQRGRVMFETTLVELPDAERWQLVDDLVALLTHGVTKDELDRGDYRPRILAHVADDVRAFEARWSGERGGRWWALALWLSQRDEDEHARIEARRRETDGQRRSENGAGRVHDRRTRREPASDVGSVPVSAAGRGDDDGRRARVRNPVRARDASRGAQLGLFGDDGSR
jgi:hypothetical protein